MNTPVNESNYPVRHDPQKEKFYIQLDSKSNYYLY